MLVIGTTLTVWCAPVRPEESSMNRLVLTSLSVALLAAAASATDFTGLTLTPLGTVALDAKGAQFPLAATASTTAYSNVTNFLGQAFANGGAASQAGNVITTLVADDLTPAGGYGGLNVNTFTFSVANLSGATVTARARVRFYLNDGAAGGPGTLVTGFSFTAIAFPAGVGLYTATLTGTMNLPIVPFWAGITFDNNTGATGATAAQLNLLGQGIFDPPTVGSSGDTFFQTSAAGSFLASNPAGAFGNFGGVPVANFGWKFDVEQPVPAMPSTWGRVKSLYR
jgi:hypothetical protein